MKNKSVTYVLTCDGKCGAKVDLDIIVEAPLSSDWRLPPDAETEVALQETALWLASRLGWQGHKCPGCAP